MKPLLIFLILLLGVFLDSLPMPGPLAWLRPDLASLLLIYWIMAYPRWVGIGGAWMLGLLQDLLSGGWPGLHALAKAVIAYVVYTLCWRMRSFPVWQQMLAVMLLLGFEMLLVWALRSAFQSVPLQATDWLAPACGALLWPLLYVTMRALRRLVHWES